MVRLHEHSSDFIKSTVATLAAFSVLKEVTHPASVCARVEALERGYVSEIYLLVLSWLSPCCWTAHRWGEADVVSIVDGGMCSSITLLVVSGIPFPY